MDPNTRALMMGAAGAGGAEKTYIEDVFSTWLYTGNNSTQTITNGIDLSGKGGLVWLKRRDIAGNNVLYNTNRGTGKFLSSNLTDAEGTYDPATYDIKSFDSTGFTLGQAWNSVNNSGNTFASWTFRKAPGFFDVVTYTGNGVAGRTIAHSLGSVPGCIIVKVTDDANNWAVYHRSVGATYRMFFNGTASAALSSTRWNNTEPTSSVFTVGDDGEVNTNGRTYVAYLFAHDAQLFGDGGNQSVIKCGSYTGTSSTPSVTVDLGWEPQWLLIKKVSGTTNTTDRDWYIVDNMRGFVANPGFGNRLSPNLSAAETSQTSSLNVLPTGFRVDNYDSEGGSGSTYIYIAIRRGPMKTPTDATKVFAQIARTGTGAAATITGTGFAPDAMVYKSRSNAIEASWQTRLQGGSPRLSSATTAAESADNELDFGLTMDGIRVLTGDGVINLSSWTYINYFLRRAPGFFDVVAYTGTGSARTVSHNLGVAPELMIVKNRDNARGWVVYHAGMTSANTSYLYLHSTLTRQGPDNGFWNSTSPTSSVFTVGTETWLNANAATYIAYLFATLTGISKVGSYTGTGTTLSIDCGFTNGARFVLIKRTDSTGDWYVWDTARGIVAANDPFLLLNSTAAENTSTDYIDPLNSGFQISSTAPAAINANGGSYIYLSVA